MVETNQNPLAELIGRELAAITFVRDYLQLAFDGPVLTLILDPVVTRAQATYVRSDRLFCDALVSLIDKRVSQAQLVEDDSLALAFESGERIVVSLHPEDYRHGPEAVLFTDSAGRLAVW